MEYVNLGRSSLKVSRIGLGGWEFGARDMGWGSEYGRRESIATIRLALELGVNLIDTAEIYGVSEQIIGEAIRDYREKVVIATKVSPWHLRYSQVLKAADRSLRRLGVKTIDLYQIHFPNPLFPIRPTMKAMERLVKEGRVNHIGLSNFGVKGLRVAQDALAANEIVSDQVQYNMLQRRIERDLLPYTEKEGISIIAYSPLAQGMLTGKYGPYNRPRRSFRTSTLLFSTRNLQAATPVLEALRSIAEKRRKTLAQVAVNWLLRKPSVIPITGANFPVQIQQNTAATSWRLSDEELDLISKKLAGFRQDTFFSLFSKSMLCHIVFTLPYVFLRLPNPWNQTGFTLFPFR